MRVGGEVMALKLDEQTGSASASHCSGRLEVARLSMTQQAYDSAKESVSVLSTFLRVLRTF